MSNALLILDFQYNQRWVLRFGHVMSQILLGPIKARGPLKWLQADSRIPVIA